MVKPVTSSEMYPNPPPSHHGWSQPPPPHHPSYLNQGRSYHYGPPHPHHPPITSHHRYPPPPSHHGHAPRSPHHGYFVSGRGPHHTRHADVPTSSPAAVQCSYTPQTIHPAQISPQTPHGPPTQQPPIHRHPQYSPSPTRVTSSQITKTPPVVHTPKKINPEPINGSHVVVTTKPPRPYTEYTMFYQLEREFILHRLLIDEDDPKAQAEQEAQSANALFKDDPLMPARYRTLPLRADWYISGKSKKPSKRKHRKTHGKIGFLELTRMIAARWAKVDDETRKYCKMMAAMELVKYKEDVESYNAYKARLEKVGEVPEDVKEKERKRRAKDMRKEKAAAKACESAAASGVASGTRSAGKRRVGADEVKSSTTRPQPVKKDNVDNDIEQFITSLVHDESSSGMKRVASPPPLPPTEAPWNHFMPGPRQQRYEMMMPPPVGVAQSKVITPERSSKRRRLPVHRASLNEPPAMPGNGPVSPDDEELIHMTFSGIDEDAIAREFYFPSHAAASGVSPGMASGISASPDAAMSPTAAAMLPQEGDAAAHPTNSTTEALYGPPVQSFDYWDALMDPHVEQAK